MELFIGNGNHDPRGCGNSPRGEGHPDRPAAEAEGPGGRPLRVLVVDDNTQSAEFLSVILNLWGHETRLAYNGTEALDSSKEFRPDAVLLDIGLLGMDGYTVARSLRDDPGLRNTTLLAVTGYGRDEDIQRATEAGFDRHLLKPIELDTLERLLMELAEVSR